MRPEQEPYKWASMKAPGIVESIMRGIIVGLASAVIVALITALYNFLVR